MQATRAPRRLAPLVRAIPLFALASFLASCEVLVGIADILPAADSGANASGGIDATAGDGSGSSSGIDATARDGSGSSGGADAGSSGGDPPGTACTADSQCSSSVCGPAGMGHCCSARCNAGGTCGATDCDTSGACTYPGSSASCGAVSCSSGQLTRGGSTCDGAGGCTGGTTSACPGGFICLSSTACKTSCAVDTDCASASNYCGAGTCTPQRGNGAACTANDQCTSGVCGTSGTGNCCSVSCATGGACGATGCSTSGACNYPGTGTSCGAASCSSGRLTAAGACNGSGACSVGAPAPCANNFACASASVCALSCTANAACQGAYACDTTTASCVSCVPDGHRPDTAADCATSCCTKTCADGMTCGATLTVNFRAIGTGQGTAAISSSPPGIRCSGPVCSTSASFDVGQVVKLTVTGLGAGSISAWLPGTCTGATCMVTMNAPQTVAYTATTNNIVFVTSKTTPANFGGLAGGDAFCRSAAASGGLPGTYVAWLATSTTSATSRLGTASGWIRPDGLPFARTIGTPGGATGIVNGQMYYPPEINELGRVQVAHAFTGAKGDGSLSAGSACSDWTTTTGACVGGESDFGGAAWTSLYAPSCGSLESLYCFGTDLSSTVTITPVAGRYAFVSDLVSGTFNPAGGLAAADAICQTEASAAGLPSSANFVALLATTTASAASRLNLLGPDWVRVDGIPIATSVANLMAGALVAPITVQANGTYRTYPGNTWTGAFDPAAVGTSATTCANWTSSSAAGTADVGFPYYTSGGWFGAIIGSCNVAFTVYCFQN